MKKLSLVLKKNILSDLSRKQTKQFWEKVKRQFAKQDYVPQNLDIDSLPHHFKTLYSNHTDQQQENISRDDIHQENAYLDNNILYDELDREIGYTELKDAVFSQNNGKSSGLDTLIAEVYKHSFAKISRVLLLLFNKIYDNGKYPSDWGTGVIIPILKGGDADDPKNLKVPVNGN